MIVGSLYFYSLSSLIIHVGSPVCQSDRLSGYVFLLKLLYFSLFYYFLASGLPNVFFSSFDSFSSFFASSSSSSSLSPVLRSFSSFNFIFYVFLKSLVCHGCESFLLRFFLFMSAIFLHLHSICGLAKLHHFILVSLHHLPPR